MTFDTRTARAVSTSNVDQVALVDADQGGAGVATARWTSSSSWVSTRTSSPTSLGDPVELLQLAVGQRRHDQQDGVGAHQPGVEHVAAATVKSLRSTGNDTASRAAWQVIGRSAEVRLVGQHRQARRAARLVAPGQLGRIEVGEQVPLGRRPALHLADDAEGGEAGERRHEPAGGRAGPRNGRGGGRFVTN